MAQAERSFVDEFSTRGRRKSWEWNGGEPLTLEHCGDKDLTFNSQHELRSYMKSQGWKSGALL